MRADRRARRALRALTAVLTAGALLSLGVVGGLSYLWCAPMGEARLHCCCPEDDAHEAGTTVRRECCEPRVVAELPAGAADPSPTPPVLPAAPDLVWQLRAADPFVVVARLAPPPPIARARAALPGPVHRACSVFLL